MSRLPFIVFIVVAGLFLVSCVCEIHAQHQAILGANGTPKDGF